MILRSLCNGSANPKLEGSLVENRARITILSVHQEMQAMKDLVIVERNPASKTLNDIGKYKYLVPPDLNVIQFVWIIRKRLNLTEEKAIFLSVANEIVPHSITFADLYKEHKDEDGFLYTMYNGENTFGVCCDD